MSAVDFFASSRVLIVAGKGGVGKTTVGATVGVAAARTGLDVLLVELEGQSRLGMAFGVDELAYETMPMGDIGGPGRLRGRRITPDRALQEYLDDNGLRAVSNRLARTGAVEIIATAAPGIRDLLALGKIRQLEQRADADLIVVDAPAAGHAVTFLTAPTGLSAAAPSGPVRQQADLVLEMLTDVARCQVVLVTLAEETPVNEAIETAFSLEDLVGVRLGPVVVNGCWPQIRGLSKAVAAAAEASSERRAVAAGRYRLARMEQQQLEAQRLAAELPLPQIELPYVFASPLGSKEIAGLAEALTTQLDAGLR